MKELITDSLRYWEPRRLGYNVVLAAVFVGTFVYHQPASSGGLAWRPLFGWLLVGVIPAVIANVFYCAAYAADIFVQMSDYREAWKRWRWLLWVGGTTFAAAVFLLHE